MIPTRKTPTAKTSLAAGTTPAAPAAPAAPADGATAVTLTMLGTGNAMATRCYNTCFGAAHRAGRAARGRGRRQRHFPADGGRRHRLWRGARAVPHAWAHRPRARHDLGAAQAHRHDARRPVRGRPARLLPQRRRRAARYRLPPDAAGQVYRAVRLGACGSTSWTTATRPTCAACGSRSSTSIPPSCASSALPPCFPSGRRLACLGDEPFHPSCARFVQGADLLLCEAFCLHADSDRFRPYEKHHSTARDAGRVAARLGAKALLLYHTEDETLATRRQRYAAEPQRPFPAPFSSPTTSTPFPFNLLFFLERKVGSESRERSQVTAFFPAPPPLREGFLFSSFSFRRKKRKRKESRERT